MKFLVVFLFTVFTSIAIGGEICTTKLVKGVQIDTKVTIDIAPEYLRDGTITVKLANGQEYTFDADLFKVVKRFQDRKVAKIVKKEVESCVETMDNRLSIVVGHGTKDGLDKTVSATQVDVSNKQGAVVGAQYQRSIGGDVSIGVQIQNNKTNSLLLGVDF